MRVTVTSDVDVKMFCFPPTVAYMSGHLKRLWIRHLLIIQLFFVIAASKIYEMQCSLDLLGRERGTHLDRSHMYPFPLTSTSPVIYLYLPNLSLEMLTKTPRPGMLGMLNLLHGVFSLRM